MYNKRILVSSLFIGITCFALSDEQKLGERLFFDPILSKNKTQSCSTCHNPSHGFIDDRDNGINSMVSLGDDGKSLGDRNSPTISYAKYSPHFNFNIKNGEYTGGQFWDGRESHLEGQAGGPPLNPIEMGMVSKTEVIDRLKKNSFYLELFEKVYGKGVLHDADKGYEAMSKAIASFERSELFSPFDSKYDRYLSGEYEPNELEEQGMNLFFSDNASCVNCHVSVGPFRLNETFTSYEYHNIGVPKNKVLFEKGVAKGDFVDFGLAKNPKAQTKKNEGRFKTPTLRNIAITAPYMHNGVFNDLKTVLEFYDKYNNTDRRINNETSKHWTEPEVAHSVNLNDLKSKKLTDENIEALIAFLKMLTDKKYEYLIK